MMETSTRDVVVIGAGPAGGVSAFRLARAGYGVLLVDRARFPRQKVCGGCLSARTLGLLGEAAMDDVAASVGGQVIDSLTVHVPGGTARRFSIPEGLATTRAELDQRIVERAVGAGVEFRHGVAARVLPVRDGEESRRVALGAPNREIVRARVVIAADGLSHPSLAGLDSDETIVRRLSRVGVGSVVDGWSHSVEGRVVRMAIGRFGYVGMVGVGNGRMNLAAALDPTRLRSERAPEMASRILAECRVEAPPVLSNAIWMGTPALSRRTVHPAGYRLLLVGDAAGYTEPFTGEGMAWALEDAREAERLLAGGFACWRSEIESAWAVHVRSRRRRDWFGGAMARVLASPAAVRVSMNLVARAPMLAHRGIGRVQGRRPAIDASAP